MTTKTIGDFTFNCEHINKREGFKHYVTMKHNGYYVSDGVSHWVNRTWERYTYQRAMINAVNNYLNEFEVEITEQYKRDKGIKRLTKKVKQELEVLFNEDKRIQDLKDLICDLKTNVYYI